MPDSFPCVTDLISPPVIGETYLVPCIASLFLVIEEGGCSKHREWLPVFGPAHADPDLGAAERHYHYDFRFLTDTMLVRWFDMTPEREHSYPKYFAGLIMRRVQVAQPTDLSLLDKDAGRVVLQPMVCQRQMPVFPSHIPTEWHTLQQKDYPAAWEAALRDPSRRFAHPAVVGAEKLCSGRRLDPNNPICPHRGFPLHQLPVDADGCVTCPGHGVRWNLSTGEMVSRLDLIDAPSHASEQDLPQEGANSHG